MNDLADAIEEEDKGRLMKLFDDNEDVDLFTLHDDDGWNVLHFASAYSKHSLDLLNFLLDHPKCSMQAKNSVSRDGKTPLDAVPETGTKVTKMLKKKIVVGKCEALSRLAFYQVDQSGTARKFHGRKSIN